VLARAIRYFGEAYIGLKLGHASGPYLRAHTWHLIAAAVALFAARYLLLMLAGRGRRVEES